MGKIKEDKKIVICCMSARDATDYHDEIKKIYPEKQVFVYTGETDDEIKEDHFKNITLQWQTADVVLYSPTIESGVNFDIEHFHSVYGIFSTGSTSQRAFFQMLARVRKVSDNTITILNPGIKEKKTADFWIYQELKACYDELRKRDKNNIQFENGKIQVSFDEYDNNFIYNEVEELNKNPCYFISYFYQLAIKKGHTVKFDSDENENAEDFFRETKENKHLLSILESKDIDYNEFQMLLKLQERNKSKREDKLQIAKFKHAYALGVDRLDIETLKPFYNRTHLINNFLSLMDIQNFKTQDDEERKIECIHIMKKLVNDLGFDNIFDKKTIKNEQFEEALEDIVDNNIIFTDFKSIKALFHLSKEPKINRTKDNKSTLGYINSLLHNFCLKISKSYNGMRIPKNQLYSLTITHNVQEIVENLRNKNRKIFDSENIFQPLAENQKVFQHLITEKFEIVQKQSKEDMFNDA